MTKVAYLILVHRNPRLLARLVRTLSTEDSAFFIHVDKKSNIREFSNICGENIFVIPEPRAVFWGEFSQVEATLDLIRVALESPVHYEYFVLLHGSDYPLRSASYIHSFFQEHIGLEFMSLVEMPAPGYPLSKINKIRYSSDHPFRRFASRALAKVGLAYRDYRTSLGSLNPYAGDACWALSRDACEYLIDFVSSRPEIGIFFRDTFTSDEVFFHTILGNSPFLSRARRSPLFTYWPVPGDHPNMIDESILSSFEEEDRVWIEDQFGAGEALFARKFSDDRLDLLDRIDYMIQGKKQLCERFYLDFDMTADSGKRRRT